MGGIDMANRLSEKVAVVTGSTAGIGRGSAELFAEEGARVVINGRRKELGHEVVRGIKDKGGEAVYCHADMAVSADVEKLIRFALDEYGRIDVLMNNAYQVHNTSVVDQEEADWDKALAVMLKAPYLACKYAIPEMIKGGGGSIVNVASVQGQLAGRNCAPYAAAKAALINLTRQIAIDYGTQGVRANALCPGRIVTEAKVEFLDARPDEVRRQHLVYPLGRPGTMREAAMAALFLASEESSFVTGHALVVDGGLTAQLQDAAAAYVERGVLAQLGIEE
jgi:NAD(P)-dependent dehydrogenase (short-subunit alcohol dehydrogenase family)